MQVTDEMFYAAMDALGSSGSNWLPPSGGVMRQILQAALDAMPKETGGLVEGPPIIVDRCFPQLADVTPSEKVRKAAAAVAGITFNLEQQYGGVDEAAARKLGIQAAQPDDAPPQAADG